MPWVYLAAAGLLEIVWAYAMKQSLGFTRLLPSVVTIAFMVGSFAFLALAMRALPLGTAYAIWTGTGAIGTFVVGSLFLGEQLSVFRVIAAALIAAGVIMMSLAEGGSSAH